MGQFLQQKTSKFRIKLQCMLNENSNKLFANHLLRATNAEKFILNQTKIIYFLFNSTRWSNSIYLGIIKHEQLIILFHSASYLHIHLYVYKIQ